MSRSATAWLLLAAGALCACAHGPHRGPAVAVEAEGWAPIVAGDPAGTARRALADAQRQAVEKVTGVLVRARVRVSQAVSVDERVWSDAAGRVSSYEVLKEGEEGGFHRTLIRAVVLKEPPPDALGPLPDDLKVAVVVDTRAFPDRGAAERGLRQGLAEAGVTVAFGPVDFLVHGEADVLVQDGAGLEGFSSCRARLSVELKDPRHDELLAARSVEASAMELSSRLAGTKALEAAGRLAGERLAGDLRRALARR